MNNAVEPHVGMELWQFDMNRRVYRKDANGRSVGGPIWREHWRKVFIVGETRVSWLVGPYLDRPDLSDKLPKRSFPGGYATSEEDINRRSWVVENQHKIAEAIRALGYDKLKAVAVLIGFDPEK